MKRPIGPNATRLPGDTGMTDNPFLNDDLPPVVFDAGEGGAHKTTGDRDHGSGGPGHDDAPMFAWTSPVDQAATSGGSGGSGGGGTTTTSTVTASPFVINITWDASVSTAPTGFQAGVLAAAQYLQSQFTDAVTVNINVGYGKVAGYALGSGALGSSSTYLTSVSYSSLLNAIKADGKTAADTTANASLSSASPSNGTFWTTTAQAKALGLMSAANTAVDGYVGFSSSLPMDYNNSDGVTGGAYDFNGVVLHELTEVMGRMLFQGGSIGSTTNSYDTADLFSYSAAGTRDLSATTAGYFSIDGGTTKLGGYNMVSGGDLGDWDSSMGNDAANAFSYSGVVNAFSEADLTLMDVIGWDRASSGGAPPTPISTPTGVTISAATASLAKAQSTNSLAAGVALAKVAQVGGASGDSYTYTLGGASAGAFTLTTSGNTATLSTGKTSVAGATNGRIYALTVTAKDTTSGGTGPAAPVDVIVGSNNGDTISAATLSGSLASAVPTFIYGLSGNDRIDGMGMTGKLWIAGGAGADTMTGGGGGSAYLYGAASESTASAMDIITNFAPTMDLIDLTGLGTSLSYAGQLGSTATSLAARSIGWQSSSGNTFVYVNTSVRSESLTGADMKIELMGNITLGGGNILHA